MRYLIHAEIDPEAGAAMEENPAEIEALVGKWQALNPEAFYFGLTRRSMTVVVEAANEDVLLEALFATWVAARVYPDVLPVATVDEFPALMQRLLAG